MDLLEYLDGYGYGYGFGKGNGYENGYGDGYGSSDGSGYDVFGDGSGNGDGIAEFDGVKGYKIDGIQTFLESIKHNIGKGFTLKRNCIKIPCYIYLTDDGFVAHGETLHKAREAAVDKSMRSKSLDERLCEFVVSHPNIDTEYSDLFQWHNILTGSCEFGRKQWCEAHGLRPTDSITIRRFIDETCNDYGGNIIIQLAEMYGIKKGGEQ